LGKFLADLERDMEREASRLGSERPSLDTIYLGGGTPSHLPAEDIAGLLKKCGDLFQVEPEAEITMEANPEDIAPDRAGVWRAAGVNRMSLGLQSLNDSALAPRGRAYTSGQAIEAARMARNAGFGNLGVDLIAGLPGETVGSFLSGVERVVQEISPEHVSVYLLETADVGLMTPLTRAVATGRTALPAEEETVEMYVGARDRLKGSGYRHYEISNFARPGHESRHNLKYWTSRPYLGVGPSAHSLVAGRRYEKPADMPRWASGARSDYTLDVAQARLREALVLQLRLLEGVDLTRFSDQWGADPAQLLSRQIQQLEADGLLVHSRGRLALTDRGLLLSNEVFGALT